MPRKEQIRFWDDRLIPGSRVTDKILLHLAGRSIIGIWEKHQNNNMKPAPGQRCFFGIPAIHWLVLLACCLIGYWPLSSSLFILKMTPTSISPPNRFLISDAIRHGHSLQWWTPYLQMGHPLHGDMQSGAWNPLVWLDLLVTRYNMTALHAETLLYILIGGRHA